MDRRLRLCQGGRLFRLRRRRDRLPGRRVFLCIRSALAAAVGNPSGAQFFQCASSQLIDGFHRKKYFSLHADGDLFRPKTASARFRELPSYLFFSERTLLRLLYRLSFQADRFLSCPGRQAERFSRLQFRRQGNRKFHRPLQNPAADFRKLPLLTARIAGLIQRDHVPSVVLL